MRIAEIFRSLQGEGRLTGTESIFVRTSGCNLRCGYCDTPYASWSPQGADLSVAEVLGRIEQLRRSESPVFLLAAGNDAEKSVSLGPRHVVLTGGEPMLFADLVPLSAELRTAGWHITVETSGTLYLPVTCDLMSISPKLSNSTPSAEHELRWAERHEIVRRAPEAIRRLTAAYDYQLKFVIDRPDDCREVEAYLAGFPSVERGRVMLMPQGATADVLAATAAWLEPYCDRHGFQFCPRRQIEWFGAQPGR